MPNGHILELSTLPTLHPRCGDVLLARYATSTIVRLSVDPTPRPSSTISREITVNWLDRPGSATSVQVQREIGWSNLAHHSAQAVQCLRTIPERVITEDAAIVVMALLLHDLAQGEIREVLEIGSGGDYLVLVPGLKRSIQMEVSGVKEDATGRKSRSRLAQKKKQVLTKCRAGFASVTTFSHTQGAIAHNYLHYVSKRPRKRKRTKVKSRPLQGRGVAFRKTPRNQKRKKGTR
jgi:hypothetical protein